MSKKEFELQACNRRNLLQIIILTCKISFDFFTGFLAINKIRKAANNSPGITMYGSALNILPERYYTESTKIAHCLIKDGYMVITGGGINGIMKSANKGAYEANGVSIGLNIVLPNEQRSNKYLTRKKNFKYFFSRKLMLSDLGRLYICFPGGFGTLDELMTILTRSHTGKQTIFPIILYGEDYWRPFVNFIENNLYKKYKTIKKEDCDLFVVLDTPEDVHKYVASKLNSCPA